jgi:hypothetical protein
MLETAFSQAAAAKLEVAIGISTQSDPDKAIAEAAGIAGRRLGASLPDFAMVVTRAAAARNAVGSLRDVLGHISVAVVPPPLS